MKIDVSNAETQFASTFKADRFPAVEGNATISSTILRGGNPLIILFQQVIKQNVKFISDSMNKFFYMNNFFAFNLSFLFL